MKNKPIYSIPLRYRKMENLHIVFWLFKDLAWCMIWKPLGITMIFPTLLVSILIKWRVCQVIRKETRKVGNIILIPSGC